MTSGTLVIVAAALGSGGVLTVLGKEVIAWIRGRTREESNAWIERDREARARRILEEEVQRLRRHLIRVGEDPGDWPTY